MNCPEAAEHVSALWDGEIVPIEASQHIDSCEACGRLLRSYAAMGAELRRAGSLDVAMPPPTLRLDEQPRKPLTFWQKGWECMRIPRFTFALLIVAIIGLASSLAVMKVGAHSSGGGVLILKASLPGKTPYTCAIDTTLKGGHACTIIGRMNQRIAGFQFEFLKRDGDRAQIGFRAKASSSPFDNPAGMAIADVSSQPEAAYWVEPGQPLKIDFRDVGTLSVTGEWVDHMPASPALTGEPMDPKEDELRMVSPLLIQDQRVIGDMQGGTASATRPGDAVVVYFQPLGRYLLSLDPMAGAVEAKVRLNRITFQVNGHEEIFLCGTPVTRSRRIWVRYEPDFKAPKPQANSYIGAGKVSIIAPEAVMPAGSGGE